MTQDTETPWGSPNRRRFIGGSDARIIMGNDEAALFRLWREKRGEAEAEDLTGNLVVQLGVVTEALNRHWYERNTGQVVTAVQRRVQHPVIRFLAATLDGMVEGTGAVFESKFMLPWSFSEEAAAQKCIAQVQHNMWVTNARRARFQLSPGVASGSNLPSRLIRSTNISCSPPRKNSGTVWNRASPLASSWRSRRRCGSRPCASST